MLNKPTNVRLVASAAMDKRSSKEDGIIRFGKRSRLFLSAGMKQLTLQVKQPDGSIKDGVLEIRQAYIPDVRELNKQFSESAITEQQMNCTGFVTTATLNQFLGKQKDTEKVSFVTNGIGPLMLGADPEFVLLDGKTGKFTYAGHIRGMRKESKFGHDGPLAELRPDPATSVEAVVKNISSLFTSNDAKLVSNDYEWIGGATHETPDRCYSIGGHIHVGRPSTLPKNIEQQTYRRVIQVLDWLVAMPLVRIDGPNQSKRRKGTDKDPHTGKPYGCYGDQRPQVNRFEWRVPSGVWLCHPDIARAVLGTTKAATESCYHLLADKNYSGDYIMRGEDDDGSLLSDLGMLQSDRVEELVNSSDPRRITKPIVDSVAAKLRELPSYEQYRQYVEEFIKLVSLSRNDRKNINYNIKDTWLNSGPVVK
jgi:hypothetical protein